MEMNYKIDKRTLNAVRSLVIYMCPEEGRHYEESGKPADHIFRKVIKVARWIDKVDPPRV
jgi:hypothetical protein